MYFYPEHISNNFRLKIINLRRENRDNNQDLSEGKDKKLKTRWKLEEVEILKRLYPNNKNEYIGEILNKSTKSINSKAYLLNLKKTNYYRKVINKNNNLVKKQAWVDDEIEYLKQNYKLRSYIEISEKLKRTYSAIFQKARQLKLKKYR